MDFDRFIDLLVEEKGLGNEDSAVIDQIKQDLASRLEDRVNAMIVDALSEDDFEGFEAAIDTGDLQKSQAFLREHIEGFDEKVASELVAFKAMYLGS